MGSDSKISQRIRIAVDAMGGDYAPENPLEGAIMAASEFNDIDVIIVGKENYIKENLKKRNYLPNNISVINADEVVNMEDVPSDVFKSKPNSSLNVSLDLQKEGKADGFVSAGNTGAVLTHATLKLGRIKGINRPTIGAVLPTENGKCMVFDVGATSDSKSIHLLEYAIMGSLYFSKVFQVEKPKVALLSIGEEKNKGNEVTIEAHKLLEKAPINFIGNVEGRDILKGKSDVVVCDGFTGNIVLKFAESILDLLKVKLKSYAEKGFFQKLRTALLAGVLKKSLTGFDYQDFGGVPLLGINGVAIIGHGKSTPLAYKNMVKRAEEVVRNNINKKIEETISDFAIGKIKKI